MNDYQKAREAIDSTAHDFTIDWFHTWEFEEIYPKLRRFADQILSLTWPSGNRMIAVVKEKQELFDNPYLRRGLMKSYQCDGYERCQSDMLKAGYIQVAEESEGYAHQQCGEA